MSIGLVDLSILRLLENYFIIASQQATNNTNNILYINNNNGENIHKYSDVEPKLLQPHVSIV